MSMCKDPQENHHFCHHGCTDTCFRTKRKLSKPSCLNCVNAQRATIGPWMYSHWCIAENPRFIVGDVSQCVDFESKSDA